MSQQHYFDPLCISPNVFQNYPTLFTHIRNEHREESSLSIRCELGVFCGSRYSSFDSYRNHIHLKTMILFHRMLMIFSMILRIYFLILLFVINQILLMILNHVFIQMKNLMILIVNFLILILFPFLLLIRISVSRNLHNLTLIFFSNFVNIIFFLRKSFSLSHLTFVVYLT
jgi:hypothetical protein